MTEIDNIGVLLAEAHLEFLAKKIPIPSAVENVAGLFPSNESAG